MKIEFIPVDYDYFDFKGKNYIKIIGRNSSGKRVCVIDDCDVYLWAILKEGLSDERINKIIKKISGIQLDLKGRQTRVEKVEVKDMNFLEKPVKALKVYATNYKDLHDIADLLDFPEIEKRRGYDLGFTTHYIIEKKINPLYWYEVEGETFQNSEEFDGQELNLDVDLCLRLQSSKEIKDKKFKPKVLAYDIETDDLKIGGGEILMISLVSENFKKVITWKKLSNNEKKQSYVEYVEDEADLLEKFAIYVREQDPDFLVGYFSDGFDLPYIKARADKLKANICMSLDNCPPKFTRSGRNGYTGRIGGIVHIDILNFIRTAYSQYMKSETLSLDEVSKEFLGDKKKDFKIKHSSELDMNELKKYYEYNLHDSQLVYDLFEKFWPDMLEFTKTIKEPIFDQTRAGLSKYVESYILHNLERFKEIPEKRPTREMLSGRRAMGEVEGAFVFEPKPGIYENIAVFDFTSMHTSIIISMNLSKTTLLEKKPKNKNVYETPEININGEKKKFYFTKDPGFFPILLREIFELRKKFKAEYKKNPNPFTYARSNAFKVLSASVHGYIGFFGARYYSRETSSSILAFVRKFNKDAIEKIQKEGYKVVFGDTDSVGFVRGNSSKKEIRELLDKFNKELPGIMELELEGFFKRGIWVTTRAGTTGAKKKYALIDENNNLKIRGFETVRRDWCKLSRDTQNKILQYVLEDGNEKRALEYVKEVIKKIKERKVDVENLIIKSQLKKPLSEYIAKGPHVIAAQKMKEKNIPISQGNLVQYYIAETEGKSKLVRDKVKLPVEEGRYEIKYYLEKQILPAVENIFHVFNIEIKDYLENSRQMTL